MARINIDVRGSLSSNCHCFQLSHEQNKTPQRDVVYHFDCCTSTQLKRFIDPATGDFLPSLLFSKKLKDHHMVEIKKAFVNANRPEVVVVKSNTSELVASKRRSIKRRLRRNAVKAAKRAKAVKVGKLVPIKKGKEDEVVEEATA
jgi:prophage tail gpP-like protein